MQRPQLSEIGEERIDVEEKIDRKLDIVQKVWRHLVRFYDSEQAAARIRAVKLYRSLLESRTAKRKELLAKTGAGGVFHATQFILIATSFGMLDWIKQDYYANLTQKGLPDADSTLISDPLRLANARRRVANIVLEKGTSVEALLEVIDPISISATPLAWSIFTALTSYLRFRTALMGVPANTGQRIILANYLGGGKTTFIVLSTISVLVALGVPPDLAAEYAGEFIVNDLKEFLMIFEVAANLAEYEGIIIPIVALDDAALVMSKYRAAPMTASKIEMKIARRIMEILQVSREGFGSIVMVASHESMLPKGVRETSEIAIIGVQAKGTDAVYSAWIETTYGPRISRTLKYLMKGESAPAIRSLRHTQAMTITGTVHPPLWTPREVYARLQKNKLEMRRRAAMATLYELIEAEKEEYKYVEDMEEQEDQ